MLPVDGMVKCNLPVSPFPVNKALLIIQCRISYVVLHRVLVVNVFMLYFLSYNRKINILAYILRDNNGACLLSFRRSSCKLHIYETYHSMHYCIFCFTSMSFFSRKISRGNYAEDDGVTKQCHRVSRKPDVSSQGWAEACILLMI